MEKRGKTILGVSVGILALVLLLCGCTIGFFIVGGGTFLKAVWEGPQDMGISADVPFQVESGEEFTIEVVLKNLADDSQKLDSIDFTLSYLEGIEVSSTFPNYKEVENYGRMEFRTYKFDRDIDPGEELVVSFEMVALQAGDFSGELDVCIGNGARCETLILRTLVQP